LWQDVTVQNAIYWINRFFQLFVPLILVISMGIWKLIMYFGHILPVEEIQAF